jgi:hypothetical protein
MSKLVLSIQVDDIEQVVEWYTRLYDGIILSKTDTTATIEFANKVVNYVEYGESPDESLWEETLVSIKEIEEEDLEEEIYSSDMSVEEFFTKENDDE